MLAKVSGVTARRPWRVVLVTLLVAAIAGFFGGPVAGLLAGGNSTFEDPESESVVARQLLERATGARPEPSLVALVEVPEGVRTAAGRERLERVGATIGRDPVVARVAGFAQTGDGAFVSRDGRSSSLVAFFRPVPDEEAEEAAERIETALADEEGVLLGGSVVAGTQVGEQVERDLARAELLAFPILFLLSLWVFRGVVAALLPLLSGAVAILLTFLSLRIANEITPLSVFALNLVTGLGLGLAIDYNLFVVSRFREELARGGTRAEALARTLATAGRTVAYSALTVAVALASLLVFPQAFLYSMGLGGILVALISAATALLLLPAVLMLLGPRVNSLSPRRWRVAAERSAQDERTGFWYRLSRAVMRRPGLVAGASAAVLIAFGLPFLRIEFTGVDPSVLPETASARQVFDAVEEEFPRDLSPLYVAAESGSRDAVARFAADVRDLPAAAAVSEPRPAGQGLWQVDVYPSASGLAAESKELVRAIRDLDPAFEARVGGETALFLDQQSSLGDSLPLALAILAAGTLVLLFAMTGSVVLPVKALLMNALTLSATLGLLVLIFQDGRLQGLLDFDSQGALESTQPILLAVIAFGLSTDYAVFLLTRIKEARDRGLSNDEAVAAGLERTGRIVTAAALLFSIAIGAFATSEIVFIKMIGVGTAFAVLLDATVVRALLVPSLMKLLGDWNWWAPGPLKRIHARFGLREEAYVARSRA